MKKLFIDTEAKQVNFLDNRFYTNDNGVTYFPSVTEILNVYPRGIGFNSWLKNVGNNAERIVEEAAEFGSKVHELTERIHQSNRIEWLNEKGEPKFDLEIWKSVLKYSDFWNKIKPELIANEMKLVSPVLRFGGQLDRIVKINGKRFLIDIKTSNYIHTSHELQLAAYAVMWNMANPNEPIDQTAVLWLKTQIRTDKIDHEKLIYQGVGDGGAWQLKIFEKHYKESFEIFLCTQKIWELENPNYRPANEVFPIEIKLNESESFSEKIIESKENAQIEIPVTGEMPKKRGRKKKEKNIV
jgi:hypothetical protein